LGDNNITLFRMGIFKKQKAKKDKWDGMSPPILTILDLYYDLRWNYRLTKVDSFPFYKRIIFTFIKAIQVIAYNKGWNSGGRQ
jgi:hypothetical protein